MSATGGPTVVYSLVYTGSVVVASTNTGTINAVQTSTDGITWTARTLAVVATESILLAYGNNTIVLASNAASGGGRYGPVIIQTSTDGITWTFRSVPFNMTFPRSINYANNKFYLGGEQVTAAGSGPIWTSTDGITWSQDTILMNYINILDSITYDSTNSLTYAFGISGMTSGFDSAVMAISADGATWQIRRIGANVLATTTTGGVTPANRNSRQPTGADGGRSTSIANNKIFYGGVTTASSQSTFAGVSKSLLVTINSPYTYQTDTQFAIPSIDTGLGGLASSPTIAGLQKSLAPLIAGSGIKYYIKT
jgi:hypothetical protein